MFQAFGGNYNSYGVHVERLDPPLEARFVRLVADTHYTAACLKFELYGCFLAKDNRNCT